MNWTRQQLKSNAKLMVKGNYILCVLVTFIVTLLAGSEGGGRSSININMNEGTLENGAAVANNLMGGTWLNYVLAVMPFVFGLGVVLLVVSILIHIFVGNALQVGCARFYLHNIHSKGELNDLAFGFQNQFVNVVKVLFMRDLYIFLWTLVFVIPGIIKAYEYYLVPYLMADNPELTVDEALNTSREMMYGEKMNTFVLELSFILWDMLSAVTAGLVGIFWVNPYKQATNAELYTAIKTRYNQGSYMEF